MRTHDDPKIHIYIYIYTYIPRLLHTKLGPHYYIYPRDTGSLKYLPAGVHILLHTLLIVYRL